MKARIPREYETLNPKQKERLKEYCIEVATKAARKQEEQNCRLVLDLYMKMVCCILHDAFGFGEKRLTMFLGNHKRLFDRHQRMVQNGRQEEYLNKRMREIFKKGGFPQEFLDSFLGELEKPNSTEEEG